MKCWLIAAPIFHSDLLPPLREILLCSWKKGAAVELPVPASPEAAEFLVSFIYLGAQEVMATLEGLRSFETAEQLYMLGDALGIDALRRLAGTRLQGKDFVLRAINSKLVDHEHFAADHLESVKESVRSALLLEQAEYGCLGCQDVHTMPSCIMMQPKQQKEHTDAYNKTSSPFCFGFSKTSTADTFNSILGKASILPMSKASSSSGPEHVIMPCIAEPAASVTSACRLSFAQVYEQAIDCSQPHG